jgi:hypothetical protein
MKQIIKNLGLSKITYRPRSKKLNEVITTEFISEVQKKIPIILIIYSSPMMRAVFVWIEINQVLAINGSNPIKFTSVSKAKINIVGFYTENEEFYGYDFGITQNKTLS